MKLSKMIVTGALAAAVAAPLGQAANNRVQVAGTLVPPSEVSQAQQQASHDPATRLVQVGGALVRPSDVSSYQQGLGSASSSTSDSSGFRTSGIVAASVLAAALILIAATALTFRNRRRVATAGC
jgi:hypothetical protein